MRMDRNELLKVCEELLPEAKHMAEHRIPVPRILNAVALHCFVEGLSGPNVEIVRSTLKFLDRNGRLP